MTKPIIYAVGPEFLARDHLNTKVEEWEDGQRASTNCGEFEWWYFDAHFEDGSTAVIVYATKPIINPRTRLTPNLSITITPPGKEKQARFSLPDASTYSASTKACDVHLGPSWVRQSQQDGHWVYELHAESGDLCADLTFTSVVPPWRPGAGKCYFGDLEHYFAWMPAIPFGTVEGSLLYEGREHAVRGTGYHDHNWGNVALPSVMDHWYWGRAQVGDYTLIFVEQIAARKYGSQRLPVFLLAKGDKVLADDSRYFSLQTGDFVKHAGGREYPREVDFTYAWEGERVQLRLRDHVMIEGVSLLLAVPPAVRRVARLFTNPYYFRFNSTLDLDIQLKELQDKVSGPALFEIMMLR